MTAQSPAGVGSVVARGTRSEGTAAGAVALVSRPDPHAVSTAAAVAAAHANEGGSDDPPLWTLGPYPTVGPGNNGCVIHACRTRLSSSERKTANEDFDEVSVSGKCEYLAGSTALSMT